MEFHLLYEGPLHSEGTEHVRNEKHAIRKVFHRQLKRLWFIDPNLRRFAEMDGGLWYVEKFKKEHGFASDPPPLSEDERIRYGLEYSGEKWERSGFNFAPLVIAEHCLRCTLEVLFLRMEERNYILQGGDIDRRIHVLFDGLRMIREGSELPTRAIPDADEKPFCCLLQDDTLVSDVTINTGRLLQLPSHKSPDQHDVYLQITVRLNPTQRTQSSWVFE